jgi:hypothetical protein
MILFTRVGLLDRFGTPLRGEGDSAPFHPPLRARNARTRL